MFIILLTHNKKNNINLKAYLLFICQKPAINIL